MRAVLQESDSKKLYIGETGEPDRSAGELLVRIQATALNRADLLQKRGLYPPPPGTTDILGLEMAGVVEEGSGGWKPGDRVMALLPGGGYAERVRIPAEMAMPIPDGLSFEEAAAIPEAFLTAYLNLLQIGNLQAGETVLIHAGASGVGTAAIQLAKRAGAHIIATAGTAEKRNVCSALGADAVIDYKAGPFAPAVQEASQGRGVNLILDFVGAPYWEQNIASLAIDGKLVLVGILGGSKAEKVDLGLLLSRRLHVIGTTLRSQPVGNKIRLTRSFAEHAVPGFRDGSLKPVIDSVWDWSEVEEAHSRMEHNRNIGKIVLRVT